MAVRLSGRRSTPRSSLRRSKISRSAAKRKKNTKTGNGSFGHVDTAFLNAHILTMDSQRPRAQALAIERGRIARIGTNREILSARRQDSQTWNLDGAVVLPGFTDCHTHLVAYGLQFFDANLRKARSISEIQDILRKQAQNTNVGEWVLGNGWDQERLKERRFPNRFDLDAAFPERPTCIIRIDEHICTVNSVALQLANITGATVDPPGGVIDRDGNTGEPTGVLRENAMDLVLSLIPQREDREVRKAVSLAIQKAVAAGLTSVHCVVDHPQHVQVLQAMKRAGELKLRVYLLIPDEWLDSAAKIGISTGFGDEMLRIQSVKIFMDGGLGARTALLEKPYSDAPDTTGVLIHAQDELNAIVEKAARHGLQVAIHAIGDRAIGMALTAIENAKLTVPNSDRLRHRIEHASVLNRGLIDRIRRSKVVASVQPHFIVSDPWVPDRVGRERAKLVYPLRSLARIGPTLVGGSDCPIEPIDPLEGLHAAVASAPEGYGELVNAQTAVEMFTKNAAYATHEEKLKGTIEEGKIADLVVFDRDPLQVPPEQICSINVLATIVGGKFVYASRRFRAMQTSSAHRRPVRRHS